MSGVRRVLIGTFVSTAAAAGLVVGSASPAAAFGGETVGCHITPGVGGYAPNCYNTKQLLNYTVNFAVLGTSGNYTYSWSVSGHDLIVSGCTATSSTCVVRVAHQASVLVIAEVTYNSGGQSATGSSTASIEEWA